MWNREVFGNVNKAGEEIQRRIQDLDARDDGRELDEVGREERRFFGRTKIK